MRLAIHVVLVLCSFYAQAQNHATGPAPTGLEKAIFAGGCFWCMEAPFRELPGVHSVLSGYTDGHVISPSYEAVSSGRTGHTEAVEVIFDPSEISYASLLRVFWQNIDPTVKDRQFCDVGSQYRSGIYTTTPAQARAAAASKSALQASSAFAGQTIYTEIKPAFAFFRAEDYHQDYARKNPTRYRYYRWNCGRDQRLSQIWGSAAPVSAH